MGSLMSFPKIPAPDNYYQYGIWYWFGAIIIVSILPYFISDYGVDFLQSIFSAILKLICMPWLRTKTMISIDESGNMTKMEGRDSTLSETIDFISYVMSWIMGIAIIVLIFCFSIFTICSWDSKTSDIVANMNSAIIQGKSNSDLEVKPYKKVVAIKKNKKLQDYLIAMQTSNQQDADVVGVKSVPILVKYADNSQERFKTTYIALRIRYVKENKPMTVAVYQTKIAKKAMKYTQTKDIIHAYNNRQVVITKYIKKKPINWQAVK